MTITDSLSEKITANFDPVHWELANESHQHGGGRPGETHFRLVLVSESFEGISRIDRQRRVMDLVADERARGLHALTMRLLTPPEWDKIKDTFEMESPACRGGSKREKKEI